MIEFATGLTVSSACGRLEIMAVQKRDVQGCIENVESARDYILKVMRIEPKLRNYLEPLIRKDLNPLAQRLDYILSMSESSN